jgi:predicted PurR-regulated permease PerM
MPKKMAAALGKQGFVNEHIQKVLADIRNYMVIKTWMSLGVGTCVTLLLVVSDVQYPLLWGFVAFLLNYIPNIGSVVAAIPPIVLATVEHGLVVGAVDAAFFVAINCVIGYAIEPRLLGNGLDLSPLIVLIALILFGWLLGPIGMFLSPPLAVIMKIIFLSFPETRWIAVLMANRPPKEGSADDEGAEASA